MFSVKSQLLNIILTLKTVYIKIIYFAFMQNTYNTIEVLKINLFPKYISNQ